MFIRIAIVIFFIVYPFIVYFGIKSLPPSFIGLLLIILLVLRFGVLKREERVILLPVLSVFFGYALVTVILDGSSMLLYYPAMVNFSLLIIFTNSLRSEESLLLRAVRARGFTISEYTPRYLYRLTLLWAMFFLLNGVVSVWTSTVSLEAWTLYNGLISYFIIGILIGAELLFRRHYIKRKSIESQ
jgi:uncharacterized membrane protein